MFTSGPGFTGGSGCIPTLGGVPVRYDEADLALNCLVYLLSIPTCSSPSVGLFMSSFI